MKFGTFDELVTYLSENDIHVSELLITRDNDDSTVDHIEEVQNSDIMIECVKILSLADSPSIPFELSESDINELHVANVNVIKEACGAGDIVLNESKLFLNICDNGDSITTKMSIAVDGTRITDVPLSLIESASEKIILSKAWLIKNL